MDEQERKEIVKAKLAQQAAKKTKDALPPVVKQPYDPENAYLSKEEFVAKRRKKKEDDLAAKDFINKRKSESEKEDTGGVPENKEEKKVAPKKTGRPKKVE
jgi:hypothetical protein